jgi:hypothetical protein
MKSKRDDSGRRTSFIFIKDKYGSYMANDETGTYPADCYSILSIYGPLDNLLNFSFGMTVYLFQMIFLVLMILSKVHPKWKVGTVDDNPSEESAWVGAIIATESSSLVRAAQIMSLLTYVILRITSTTKEIAVQLPVRYRDVSTEASSMPLDLPTQAVMGIRITKTRA